VWRAGYVVGVLTRVVPVVVGREDDREIDAASARTKEGLSRVRSKLGGDTHRTAALVCAFISLTILSRQSARSAA
jgi:hypothetical protein